MGIYCPLLLPFAEYHNMQFKISIISTQRIGYIHNSLVHVSSIYVHWYVVHPSWVTKHHEYEKLCKISRALEHHCLQSNYRKTTIISFIDSSMSTLVPVMLNTQPLPEPILVYWQLNSREQMSVKFELKERKKRILFWIRPRWKNAPNQVTTMTSHSVKTYLFCQSFSFF